MKTSTRIFLAVAAFLVIGPIAAQSGNTSLFSSRTGDVVFPISPPTAAGAPGAIDNMTIGATTPAPATFSQIQIDNGVKTATATAGAATLNKDAGVITSEALVTAAGASYTLTLTDSSIAAADQVFASVKYGTATTGTPAITMVTEGAGQVVIVVQNVHASVALNGTIAIKFVVLKN